MKTIRKGLRDGDLVKDTYERVTCAECDSALTTENDPDEISTIRRCPECDSEYKEIR